MPLGDDGCHRSDRESGGDPDQTGDDAVARPSSRPPVLDRYQPHLHRRWNEGCHDAAVLHAELTALGYRGSLRTVYRYLQPGAPGPPHRPVAWPPLKIGQVTSWLLRRAEDLDPRDQQMLTEIRAHCIQLDARQARNQLRQDD